MNLVLERRNLSILLAKCKLVKLVLILGNLELLLERSDLVFERVGWCWSWCWLWIIFMKVIEILIWIIFAPDMTLILEDITCPFLTCKPREVSTIVNLTHFCTFQEISFSHGATDLLLGFFACGAIHSFEFQFGFVSNASSCEGG